MLYEAHACAILQQPLTSHVHMLFWCSTRMDGTASVSHALPEMTERRSRPHQALYTPPKTAPLGTNLPPPPAARSPAAGGYHPSPSYAHSPSSNQGPGSAYRDPDSYGDTYGSHSTPREGRDTGKGARGRHSPGPGPCTSPAVRSSAPHASHAPLPASGPTSRHLTPRGSWQGEKRGGSPDPGSDISALARAAADAAVAGASGGAGVCERSSRASPGPRPSPRAPYHTYTASPAPGTSPAASTSDLVRLGGRGQSPASLYAEGGGAGPQQVEAPSNPNFIQPLFPQPTLTREWGGGGCTPGCMIQELLGAWQQPD